MSMTVVVTRNVPDRVRGFLASSMLELAPGVYSAPRLAPPVRERIWEVMEDWLSGADDTSAIMVWAEPGIPGGQAVRTLGLPPIRLVEVDGLIISHKPPRAGGAAPPAPSDLPDPMKG